MPDAFRHRVDVARRAGDRLRHHAALQVEDAGGQVAGLAHRGGERGADHRLRLLLDDRDQAVPHDLALDLRQRAIFVGHHARSPASVRCSPSAFMRRAPARADQGGGLVLGDDRRAGDARARARATVRSIDRPGGHFAGRGVAHRLVRAGSVGASPVSSRHRGAAGRPRRCVATTHGVAHDLDIRARHRAVVEARIFGVVGGAERGRRPAPAAVRAGSGTGISWPWPT